MRKHVLKMASLLSVVLAVALFVPQCAAADDDEDPPSRVARLSYANGTVSFNPGGTDDWVSAVVNRPIISGDKLWTDNGARAELHIGSAAIRLSDNTGFSFLNLDDRMAQIRLTEGTLNVRVRRLEQDETFEIDTPNLAFSILRPGNYKINVNEAGDATVVVVREGEGEVTGGGSAYAVHPRETGTFSGTDQLDADIQRFGDNVDDFDHWCGDRDRREDRSQSSRYVSSDVIGYEDLDDNGGWRPVPEYGTVWFPHTTIVGWAPYRYGHWVWISPWGWTWVDDAPWGFAPFHYGRWVTVGGVWGWVPCAPRAVVGVGYVRPVYAPALVAWVGGPHFSVGIGIGGGGGVGVAWFPLGPREVYVPSYHVSRTYVTNVNVSNTTVNNTVVNNYYNNVVVNKNVTNIKYVNQTARNGVTATSQQNFTSAQPVGRNMMRVDRREVESAQVNPTTPTVAPQQRSVLGAGAGGAARPPARFQERSVVAKTPPPPAPASFVKQQQAIQANGGRPPAVSQMRQVQTQTENTQQARPNIKIAPPSQTATPQNVRANGSGQPQNNNGNRPGQPQTNVQPNVQNRPPASNNAGQQPQGNQPGNSPANNGREKSYNDRPASARPTGGNPNPPVNSQLDQRHQQQLDQLRLKQDQERQKIEQKQIQEQQRIQQRNTVDAGRQQVDQRQQQQPQQIDQRQVQQQQKAQQTKAENARRQQVDQKQQQVDQKQQQQLRQLEQKHGQEQQKLEQKQQQERQKPQAPPKDKPSSKPPKDDKPPHRG
ncbi:MAG TPA: DUF6600 domain-containing protein [Candidatus Limnocylindria bacterium]|nr:DUF6600 domain-containing protein [Candidatus Limnocylindria bacterium]